MASGRPVFGMAMATRDYNAALREYIRWNKREIPEILNKRALNIALRTVQMIPQAANAAFNVLSTRAWWPKLIASIMVRKNPEQVHFVQPRSRKRPGRARRGKLVIRRKRHYTVAMARKMSRRIVTSRRRSRAFMKSGFLKLANQLPGRSRSAPKRLTKSRALARPAEQVLRPVVTMFVEYTARNMKDSRKKQRVVMLAFREALSFEARDMWDYIERKMADKARRISA